MVEVEENSEDSEGCSDEDDEVDDSDNELNVKRRKKGKLVKSGIFAKASSTRIVKPVLHAHSMIDLEETLEGKDLNFHELPFHMLVAGKLENNS